MAIYGRHLGGWKARSASGVRRTLPCGKDVAEERFLDERREEGGKARGGWCIEGQMGLSRARSYSEGAGRDLRGRWICSGVWLWTWARAPSGMPE